MQHVTHKTDVDPAAIMASLIGMVEAKLRRPLTLGEKILLQGNPSGAMIAQLLGRRMHVKMYTKSNCELCEKAKTFLATHPNIPVDEVKLELQVLRDRLYDRFNLTGSARLMPQVILIEDDGSELYIGGWKELEHSGLPSLFKI